MSRASSPRVFYIGMCNTGSYVDRVGEPLFIGAASVKMTGVVEAVRAAGMRSWFVSLPVLGKKSKTRAFGAILTRNDFGPGIFLCTAAQPLLRKIVCSAALAFFCFSAVRKRDIVIFYNHSVEYVLGALVLRARGIRPILDIEDAPPDDEHGLRHAVGRLVFYLLFRLSRPEKLVVSKQLARKLAIGDYCAVYGAVPDVRFLSVQAWRLIRQKWRDLINGGALHVHYGGSLRVDTGLALFCEAVNLLTKSSGGRPIIFHVTGMGGGEELSELQACCAGSRVQVLVRHELSRGEYLRELLECHAALSLKLPGRQVAETTFPSKVVEITSNGLLLVTTLVSDVPELFDAENAVPLAVASPEYLASAIQMISDYPRPMNRRMLAGYRRALCEFRSSAVGASIVRFLCGT